MTTVTLVYPYFRPQHDKSIFRFPPLGLGYIASYLKQHDISVSLVDCTFLSEKDALEQVKNSNPEIVGIYSMFSMKNASIRLAKLLRNNCEMLVAGGPLPTIRPREFLEDFDVVAVGEGEETMLELVQAVENNRSLSGVKGVVYKNVGSKIVYTPPRAFIEYLDNLPFPARDQFDNQSYKNHYSKRFGYTSTSLITSRGCPFYCDFCSRAVFGNKFRTRSAASVVDEMESVQALGYDRTWFADDCFTLYHKRLTAICSEIVSRGLKIDWECLSRVDTIDADVLKKMKQAGCVRLFFGLESGNDEVLALMRKKATTRQAKEAVQASKSAGIEVGAFFIVGYPGETNETVLDTVRFASSLPLDYLSFTLPYPIPDTPLYERVKAQLINENWDEPKHRSLIEHKLIYRSSFSEAKLKFAIMKATVQFRLRKYLGTSLYEFLGKPFEVLTDLVFRLLR